MRWRIIGFLAAFIIFADQFTKHLIKKHIPLFRGFEINSFFNIVHARNKGAAFGFLNDPSINWQIWFFLIVTVLALGIIFFLAKKAQKNEYCLFVALGLISGGAVGNAIDRIFLGEVVDFLDFHYKNHHWPAFNLADMAICLGAAFMFLIFFQPQKNKEED